MSQISDFRNPWRQVLLSEPASFRGIVFHVEQGGRSSGVRTVLHQYPKRSTPYAESMGREARHFNFSGYLVYMPAGGGSIDDSVRYDYVSQRKQLYEALEKEDAGRLVHPVFCNGGMSVMCTRFTMTESRERGGYTQFEMQFVEAGEATNSAGFPSPTAAVLSSMSNLENTALGLLNTVLSSVRF